MRRLRIVLGGPNLAGYPEGGGHWSWFLQYMLGLKGLEQDVFWLELLSAADDPETVENPRMPRCCQFSEDREEPSAGRNRSATDKFGDTARAKNWHNPEGGMRGFFNSLLGGISG